MEPLPVTAGAVLAAAGAAFVVVGSAALHLQGAKLPVGDLDVVPEPTDHELERLADAVESLVIIGPPLPSWKVLTAIDLLTLSTSFGAVDLLLARARAEYWALLERSRPVEVHGVEVLVASPPDAWRLRQLFKGVEHE